MKKAITILITSCLLVSSLSARKSKTANEQKPETIIVPETITYEALEQETFTSPASKKEKIVKDLIQRFEKDEIEENNLIACIKKGVIQGPELDVYDNRSGKTLLHHAAEKGKGNLVKLIIDSGGTPSLRTRKGENTEQIIKRKMLSVTAYGSENKRDFKQHTNCLTQFEKASNRILSANKKVAQQRKKQLLNAIDL